MNPDVSLDVYRAARAHAAWFPRANRGRIVVSGRDRAAYLHGLLTNDITALQPGGGCYAAYLTPQGRMITDLWVYELGDVILLTVGLGQKATLLAKLDQFIFSEDVQLGDVTDTFSGTVLVGPAAATTLAQILGDLPGCPLAALPEHGNARGQFQGQPVIVLRVTDTGEPGFEVLCDRAQEDGFRAAIRSAGVPVLDPVTADVIRVEDGVPEFGRDMDEETIPLEAGLEARAISLTKGCYVGQEVIIRVLHRGHGRVARRLVGLACEGDRIPVVGAAIRSAERDLGHVTSSAFSPDQNRPIALGYVQRDFTEPGTRVSIDQQPATVMALPFRSTP